MNDSVVAMYSAERGVELGQELGPVRVGGAKPPGGRRERRRGIRRQIAEVHQRRDVVRPARFDARPDAALAHAAERLPQHDRAGRRPIDVQVAGANALAPQLAARGRRGFRGPDVRP